MTWRQMTQFSKYIKYLKTIIPSELYFTDRNTLWLQKHDQMTNMFPYNFITMMTTMMEICWHEKLSSSCSPQDHIISYRGRKLWKSQRAISDNLL